MKYLKLFEQDEDIILLRKERNRRNSENDKMLIKQTNILIDKFMEKKKILMDSLKKHFNFDESLFRRGEDIYNPAVANIDITHFKDGLKEGESSTWDLMIKNKVKHYRHQGVMLYGDYDHLIDYIFIFSFHLNLRNSEESVSEISTRYLDFQKNLDPDLKISRYWPMDNRSAHEHLMFEIRRVEPLKVENPFKYVKQLHN